MPPFARPAPGQHHPSPRWSPWRLAPLTPYLSPTGLAAFVRDLGSVGGAGSGGLAMTVGGNGVAAGETLVLAASQGGVQPLTAVVDSQGNRWVLAAQSALNNRTSIYYCYVVQALAPTDTITVTVAAGFVAFGVAEFTGLVNPVVDVLSTNGAGATTSPTSGPTPTTNETDAIAVGVAGSGASPTSFTQPGAGWVMLQGGATTNTRTAREYKIVQARETETFSGTYDVAAAYDAVAVVLTTGGAAPPGPSAVTPRHPSDRWRPWSRRPIPPDVITVPTTPVSATISNTIEALGGIATSLDEPVEATQGLATTTDSPVESLAAVAQTGTDPVEAGQGIVSTGSDPIEATRGIATSASEPTEAAQGVATTAPQPVESAQGLAASLVAAFESLASAAAALLEPIESLGGVTASSSEPVEAAGGVAQIANSSVEATQSLARTLQTQLETLTAVLTAAGMPIESAVAVAGAALVITTLTRSGPASGITRTNPRGGLTTATGGTGATRVNPGTGATGAAGGDGDTHSSLGGA